MLRYKTETRPGLVALYDIRPGNGAGQFLQPRSPHGASQFGIPLELRMMEVVSDDNWSCKTCKAPVKSSPPANQHPTFYRPDVLPVANPQCQSTELRTARRQTRQQQRVNELSK